MPTYQYRCPSCGHEFEKFEKMTAKTRPKCPQCGTRAERVISAAGLVFKGSGFYITDYKRSGEPKPANASGAAEKSGAPEKKKDSGGEKTPEAPKKPSKSQGSE